MARPNILFIMSDDHAANAISCYGSILAEVFSTPNMDRLATEGARLNNFFSTNSICTPARATIMTGQYGHVNGVRTLSDHWNPDCRENLPALLREAGYTTSVIGKWHLHCYPEGFDHFDILPGQGKYHNPEFLDQSLPREMLENPWHERLEGGIKHEGYVTDIITEKTVHWLRSRDRDKPFFLMCHHKAPHDFWEYAERHEHLFDNVTIPEPNSLFEDRSHRSIASRDYGSSIGPRSEVRNLFRDFCRSNYVTGPLTDTENLDFEGKTRVAYQKYLKDYLRTVAGIDDSVGTVLAELEGQGVLDDTIVIYTSDQGMFLGEHDYQDKRWSYEESLKCPFLIRYPREIAPGSVIDELMANVDLAPTLLDYAGAKSPDTMQGVSCRGMLSGADDAWKRDHIYFRYWMHLAHKHHNPAHYGIRTDSWKLIFYYGLPLDAAGAVNEESPAGWELYDMQSDPCELHNLYGDPAYTYIAENLREKLEQVKQECGDTDEQYPELRKRLAASLG